MIEVRGSRIDRAHDLAILRQDDKGSQPVHSRPADDGIVVQEKDGLHDRTINRQDMEEGKPYDP